MQIIKIVQQERTVVKKDGTRDTWDVSYFRPRRTDGVLGHTGGGLIPPDQRYGGRTAIGDLERSAQRSRFRRLRNHMMRN